MAVFDDALAIETGFARQCFTEEPDSALPGSAYCRQLADRYIESEHLRFLLRTAYLPPEGLRSEIDTGYVRYLDQLGDDFEQRLREWAGSKALPEDVLRFYRQAYLGIADSLHVKLIYTNTQEAQERLSAMLGLLSESLAKHRGR